MEKSMEEPSIDWKNLEEIKYINNENPIIRIKELSKAFNTKNGTDENHLKRKSLHYLHIFPS